MHEKKISQAEIARTLRRDRSTICRELQRNFWRDREVPVAEGYWHFTAQQLANARRRRYRKLLRDPLLCSAVIERLKDGWSPEQISGRLRLVSGSSARLSHETIYQYLFSGRPGSAAGSTLAGAAPQTTATVRTQTQEPCLSNGLRHSQ